jgi:FADH2 O2-dependent halogenase
MRALHGRHHWSKAAVKHDFDIAIVGSGFGGSLLAMIARRLGHTVALLEKTRHPRFAIGESSTPLANLLLEELATCYELPRLLPLTKWGTWQRTYPEVGGGLKCGFTFHHHTVNQPFQNRPDRRDQLLVAASPHDGIGDTHWYRPDFDHFLMREAAAVGAVYFDETSLNEAHETDNDVTLVGERHGEPLSLRARFVVDATGPRGFLHRALQLPEVTLEYLPSTQGLFTHFTGVRRLDEMPVGQGGETPPYPIDDAAVHHVFDGGWIWVLRFNNGITSAGVAARDELANELRFHEGAGAWERLLERLPTVGEQFATAEPCFDFIHARRLSFRSGVAAGRRWALLPSAAGFIDPLLSTGFPLTLLGISRLAEIFERDWERSGFADSLQDYARATTDELLAAERLVAALYASMDDFPTFTALSLLYFAAASYAETARRLQRPHLAGGFLMHDHPQFGPQSRTLCERVIHGLMAQEKKGLLDEVLRLIEPFDIAGLAKLERRNWYPVLADDLFESRHKFGAAITEIEQLLERCEFTPLHSNSGLRDAIACRDQG